VSRRDLADLAAIARKAAVDAHGLAAALHSEATRRELDLANHIAVPTEAGWTAGYARVAREIRWLPDRTVDAALETVGRFIDPVLGGLASGSWNHDTLAWE
jgi:lambda repressor-like predicted transcriptional regulator